MYRFKKTTLAIFMLASNSIFAGTMGPVCTEGNATVPCEHSAWGFGAQALYLQPTFQNDFYTGTFTNAEGRTTHGGHIMDWGWGFKLEALYQFSSGNDLNLNWYHYDKSTSSSSTYSLPTPPHTPHAFNIDINPKWNAVNAEFGQLVKFGELKSIRFHAGAQYAQLETNIFGTTPGFAPNDAQAKFTGFGPRFGVDMAYHLPNGLGVYGNGAAALLVGSNKFTAITTGALSAALAGRSYGSTRSTIPEIEGKLGATYSYAMPQGNAILDVGYMWVTYVNGQAYLSATNLGGGFDFSMNGPYVGLKWVS